MFQQTFKGSVGRPMADRQEKKVFPTKPRVRNTMIKFFLEIFCISMCKTLPLNLWTF